MERQTVSVDISPRKGIVPQLRVSQGDIGRPLGVYVMQDGAALDCSGYTADLYVLKADGNYYVVHVTVDSTIKNLITWDTAEQETPVAGECAAQIRIMQGTDDIGTARFVEYVEASPGFSGAGSQSAIESLEEYVRQAAASAQTASDAADTATGAASTAAADAQTASNAATAAAGYASSAHDDAETASGAAATAQAVLDSIPSDYSTMSSDVTALKTAIEQKAPAIYPTASGSIATFPDGADGMPIKSLAISLEPVQSGSGDPSPQNVRPITGHSSVAVTRTGKNLLPTFTEAPSVSGLTISVDDGKITISGTVSSATVISAPFGEYKWDGVSNAWLSGCPSGGDYSNGYSLRIGSVSNGVYSKADVGEGIALQPSLSATILANVPLCFQIVLRAGTYSNLTFAPMLCFGSSASPYEEYQGISVQIPLGQTVYGGTLDPVKGTLIVDRAIIDMGSKSWSKNTASGGHSYFSCASLSDRKIDGSLLSSSYKFVGVGANSLTQDCTLARSNTGVSVYVRDDAYSTAADFRAAVSGVQLCYYLNTPLAPIPLDPVTIQTLLGYNAIWSDGGDVTVEYPVDTKTYIDNRINATRKLIAGIETGFVASKLYAVGDMLIIVDDLYKVTAQIASGATITVGTNVTKTTVAEQLIALANA